MRLKKWLGGTLSLVLCGIAAAQDHPAFTPPTGFAVSGSGDQQRVFDHAVPNGDRLRIRVILQAEGADPETIAKGPALEEGDQIRPDSRQEIKTGTLGGVSYSVLGKSETVDGISFTRYRRVMGLKIESNPISFAVRADILAKEPKVAQSTLESMARSLAEWQQRLGGVSTTPPPDPTSAPSTRPVLGGDQMVRLTGGGDLEIQVPAFWGRSNLSYETGQEEILLGPARDVIEKVTRETIAKDKDRIGPYISITRIQKDTFKDLVDVQLLDIQESLLADYVARMSDAGVVLTLSADRDEGTLGTRTVISVPFEEKRASGTQHRGRSVFMMHRGSLVIVTASHPLEKFDEGWPDIAKAFDTLLFTGNVEPDGAPTDSKPAEPAPAPSPSPTPPAPAPESVPTPPRPAPPEWTRESREGLKATEIPLPTPIAVSIPQAWTLLGEVDPAKEVQSFLATPKPDGPQDLLSSALRVEYYSYREELSGSSGLARLSSLLRLRLDQDAKALGLTASTVSAQELSISGRPGFAIQYTLRGGDRESSGTLMGTLIDGTVVVVDLRIAAEDQATLSPVANDVLGSFKITQKDEMAPRTFGPYGVLVPAGWEVAESENPGGGRNVFVRAPSGVDVRFQTAVQKRPETIDTEVLRRVATGFLVEGLKVLTLKDMAAARRFLPPGGGPGFRFETVNPEARVLVFASMQGEHMVFALRGSPPAYRGRDLAIASQVMRSFSVAGVDRPPRADPPRVAGNSVSRRTAYSRTDLDAVAPDGSYRPASSLLIALLPDGSAGVVSNRNGRTEDLRGKHRIDGDQLTIEGQGIGKLVYRLSDDGETLRGEQPGDALFRAREAETP